MVGGASAFTDRRPPRASASSPVPSTSTQCTVVVPLGDSGLRRARTRHRRGAHTRRHAGVMVEVTSGVSVHGLAPPPAHAQRPQRPPSPQCRSKRFFRSLRTALRVCERRCGFRRSGVRRKGHGPYDIPTHVYTHVRIYVHVREPSCCRQRQWWMRGADRRRARAPRAKRRVGLLKQLRREQRAKRVRESAAQVSGGRRGGTYFVGVLCVCVCVVVVFLFLFSLLLLLLL